MPQLGLSPVEEAFFRAGDAMSEGDVPEVTGIEDGSPAITLWQAVVGWLRGTAFVS